MINFSRWVLVCFCGALCFNAVGCGATLRGADGPHSRPSLLGRIQRASVKIRIDCQGRTAPSTGSAFVVHRDSSAHRAILLTAFHVLNPDCHPLRLRLSGGGLDLMDYDLTSTTAIEALSAKGDRVSDIAIFTVADGGHSPAVLRIAPLSLEKELAGLTRSLLAAGFDDPLASSVVSRPLEHTFGERDPRHGRLLMQGAVRPGMSGGPIILLEDEQVVGVVSDACEADGCSSSPASGGREPDVATKITRQDAPRRSLAASIRELQPLLLDHRYSAVRSDLERPPSHGLDALPDVAIRRPELERQVRDALTNPGPGWVLLWGVAGAGKTTLATLVANDLLNARAFVGGVYFFSVKEKSSRDLLEEIAQRVFPQEYRERSPSAATLATRLRSDPRLIVLDDVGWLNDMPTDLEQALQGTAVLMTSRKTVATSGTGHTLHAIPVGDLSVADARLLLTRSLDLDLATKADAGELDALTREVGNNPLGIRIISGYMNLNRLPATEMIRLLQKEPLCNLVIGAGQGVCASLDLSWRRLSGMERDILVVMAKLASQPVPKEMLVAALGTTPDKLDLRLGRLRTMSLVRFERDMAVSLHPLIYAWAKEKSEHVFYLSFKRSRIAKWLIRFDWKQLTPNLRQLLAPHIIAMHQWLLHDGSVREAFLISVYWPRRLMHYGYWPHVKELWVRQRAQCELDNHSECAAFSNFALFSISASENLYDNAGHYWRETLRHFRGYRWKWLGKWREYHYATIEESMFYWYFDRDKLPPDERIAVCLELVSLAKSLPGVSKTAASLYYLSHEYRQQGKPAQAERIYSELMSQYKSRPWDEWAHKAAVDRIDALIETKEYDAADALTKQGIQFAERRKDKSWMWRYLTYGIRIKGKLLKSLIPEKINHEIMPQETVPKAIIPPETAPKIDDSEIINCKSLQLLKNYIIRNNSRNPDKAAKGYVDFLECIQSEVARPGINLQDKYWIYSDAAIVSKYTADIWSIPIWLRKANRAAAEHGNRGLRTQNSLQPNLHMIHLLTEQISNPIALSELLPLCGRPELVNESENCEIVSALLAMRQQEPGGKGQPDLQAAENWLHVASQKLSSKEKQSPLGQAALNAVQAELSWMQGDHSAARVRLGHAETLCPEKRDAIRAACLESIADVAARIQNGQLARRLYREQLEILREAKASAMEIGRALENIADQARRDNQPDEVWVRYQALREHWSEPAHKCEICAARAIERLGTAAEARAKGEEDVLLAEQLLNDANKFSLNRVYRGSQLKARLLLLEARIQARRRQTEFAIRNANQALAILDDLGVAEATEARSFVDQLTEATHRHQGTQ